MLKKFVNIKINIIFDAIIINTNTMKTKVYNPVTRLKRMHEDLQELKDYNKLNRRRIMRRAHYLVRTESMTLSEALKQVWSERKSFVIRNNEEIKQYIDSIAEMYNVEQDLDPERPHRVHRGNAGRGERGDRP